MRLPSTSGRAVTVPTSVANDLRGAPAGPMASSSRCGAATAGSKTWVIRVCPARSCVARDRIRLTPSTT